MVKKTNQETLNPIPPNAGIESAYRRKMQNLIKSMQNSITYFVTAAYRAADTDRIAGVKKIETVLGKLKSRWLAKFDAAAPTLAAEFVAKASQNLDANLVRQMRDRKFAIHFELTPQMRAIVHTEIVQNVSLIQSIPSQYFTEVEGLVMRSVEVGGDLKTLTDELHKRFGITMGRAGRIVPARRPPAPRMAASAAPRAGYCGPAHPENKQTRPGGAGPGTLSYRPGLNQDFGRRAQPWPRWHLRQAALAQRWGLERRWFLFPAWR